MKNFKNILSLGFAILLFSCSNETTQIESISSNKIENSSMEQKLAYKKTHLMNVANWVHSNLDNENLKSKLFSINNNSIDKTIKVKSLFEAFKTQTKNDANIENSLKAFYNIEGENWDVAITITDNIDRSNQKLNLKNKISNEVDILYFFEEEETDIETLEFTGYESLDEQSLTPIADKFTIEDVEGRITFTFELVPAPYDDVYIPNSSSYSGAINANNYLSGIEKMTIKDHKEDWIAGGSEINLKAYRVFFDGNLNGPGGIGDCGISLDCSVACTDYLGKEISSYNRREVRNRNEKSLNFKFHNSRLESFPPTINTVVFYVIFERDNWPAPIKSYTFPFADGSQRKVEFRSWQSQYHAERVLATGYNNNYENLDGYLQDNNAIRYNLRKN